MSKLNDLFQNIQAGTGSLGGSIDADTQSLGIGSLMLSEQNDSDSIQSVLQYDSKDEDDLITKNLAYFNDDVKSVGESSKGSIGDSIFKSEARVLSPDHRSEPSKTLKF